MRNKTCFIKYMMNVKQQCKKLKKTGELISETVINRPLTHTYTMHVKLISFYVINNDSASHIFISTIYLFNGKSSFATIIRK